MQEILKQNDILKMLQAQKRTGGVHSLWVREAEGLRQFPFKLNDVRPAEKCLIFSLNLDAVRQIKELSYDSEEVKVFLNNVGVTFFSYILECKKGSGALKVSMPEVVYFKDRRKEERIRPDSLLKVIIDFREAFSLKKDVLDLSKNGVSFLLRAEDSFTYKKGSELSLKLEFESQEFELYGQVVDILKIKPFALENVPYGDRLISVKLIDKDQLTLKRYQKFFEAIFSRG